MPTGVSTTGSTGGLSINTDFVSIGWCSIDILVDSDINRIFYRVGSSSQIVEGTFINNSNYGKTFSNIDIGSIVHRGSWISVDSACLFSDVVIYTNDGIAPTGFYDNPMARTIKVLPVDANGYYNDWTPISGENFSNVNEIPYNDSTYTRGLSTESKQTFSFSGLGSGDSAIKTNISAIKISTDLKDVGATISSAAPIQTISGTDQSLGSNLTVNRSNFTRHTINRTTNPLTGVAYTPNEIESLDIGFTVI